MRRLAAALLFGLWAALAGAADGLVPLPQLNARMTDLTGTLGSEQRQALETRLAAFESRKGSQIAVLLLSTTQPEAIEQFGIRLAEAWKVGRAGVDDGAIFIVAKNDRALRIEVGYGLEGALNDATAKRIVSEIMVPRLRQSDYFSALQAGVDAAIGVIEGEPLPAAASGGRVPADGDAFFGLSENLFFAGLLGIVISGAVLRFFLGNLLGSGIVGGLTGVVGWLLAGSLMGVLIGLVGGFLLAMFGLDILFSIAFNRGGGSGGSGGWSGGGGGFGGGGASGRW